MDTSRTPYPIESTDTVESYGEVTYPLLSGEHLRSITEHPLRIHSQRPSTIKELLRLTRADHEVKSVKRARALLPLR